MSVITIWTKTSAACLGWAGSYRRKEKTIDWQSRTKGMFSLFFRYLAKNEIRM